MQWRILFCGGNAVDIEALPFKVADRLIDAAGEQGGQCGLELLVDHKQMFFRRYAGFACVGAGEGDIIVNALFHF